MQILTATIASGESLSGAVQLGGASVLRIVMPAGWDAAALTFQVSEDGSTFRELNAAGDSEAAVSIAVSAGKAYQLVPSTLAAQLWLKVRSGTSGSPVNQTAARTITLVTDLL
jgi:hypothetical protein